MDHSYLISPDHTSDCLNCKLEYCVYDYKRTDPRRRSSNCVVESSRKMTGTEIMMQRNKQVRLVAFKKINDFLANGGKLNVKQAAKLTGLSAKTISSYIIKGMIRAEKVSRVYNIIEAINE